ncbi:transcriptional regulator [Filimonas zeae]|uniref:DUF4325 domain-containing protein n=1 Tax=Filimonas zeae TaxID=1737353 RepID=A0A917INZ0_9BACT|nr:STAS-like domain-containing protein [Filimonas zeae]MDR6337403.1 transcriptional regulator [Filimonas zeae]GGH58438.1 hypothetical protein GCM10011379_04170 [Filimonas zeae]
MTTINDAMNEIKIGDVLHSSFAVSTEQGEMIFKLISNYFTQDNQVAVDFTNVDLIVSTFLNAAIGQLYGEYTTDYIQKHLTIENMSNEDLQVLKLVTDRAKEYFKDKRGFDNVFKKNFPNAEE